eukprot:GHVU01167783.1.p1 GENE.GHVU01167783.1~~GHVU01167783.1.p1  ORF type:complete len:277 (+),score=11.17 GHVU01167783.1:150-980(+)
MSDWPSALPLVERRINDIAVRNHDYPPRVTFLNQETGRTTAYNVLHLPDAIPEVSDVDITDKVNEAMHDFVTQLDFIHQWKTTDQVGHFIRIRTPRPHRRYQPVHISEGDFVLVARPEPRRRGEKLLWRWIGPMVVKEVLTNYIFLVEELNTHRRFKVHARRIMFYCDAQRATIADLARYAEDVPVLWTVDKLLSCKWVAKARAYRFTVSWEGYEDFETTLEPVEVMVLDIPREVRKFLENPPHTLSAPARKHIETLLANHPRPEDTFDDDHDDDA